MGKAAENEQHKLMAAFYNNLAATAAASGVLVPVFGLITKYADWARGKRVRDGFELLDHLAQVDWIEVVFFLFFFGFMAWIAYVIATLLREKSDAEAAKIQD